MKPLDLKLRIIYLPYLLLSASVTAGYMLLRWLLDLSAFDNEPSTELLADYWIPIIVPPVLVIVLLRKRLRILSLNRAYVMYLLIAVSTVMLPMEHARNFILSAPNKLHHIEKLSDIDTNRPGRYYKIDKFRFNSSYSVLLPVNQGEGARIHTKIYAANPISDSSGLKKPVFWHVTEYSSIISRKDIINNRYNEKMDAFTDSVKEADDNLVPCADCYYEMLSTLADKGTYLQAIKSVYYIKHKIFLLKAVHTPFGQRYLYSLANMIFSFFAGSILFLLFLLAPRLDVYGLKRYLQPYFEYIEDEDEVVVKKRGITQFFIPDRYNLFATPVLIDLNVLYFIIIVVAGNSILYLNPVEVEAYGGNSISTILSGQIWRLLLNTFLHSGFMHLAGNMFSLAAIGAILEPVIGRGRMLIAYMTCGVFGSIFSMVWHQYNVVSGASTPIFGMYGVLLGLIVTMSIPRKNIPLYTMITGFMVLNGMLMTGNLTIDSVGHAAGFMIGILTGVAYSVILKMSGRQQFTVQ